MLLVFFVELFLRYLVEFIYDTSKGTHKLSCSCKKRG